MPRVWFMTAVLPFLSVLSGCEAPVMIAASNNDAELSGATAITFPAQLLISLDGQPARSFSGEMIGRMSGAADIELTSEDGETCLGAMSPDGTGSMTCEGVTVSMDRRGDESASMSGTVYRSGNVGGTQYATAFG